MIDYSLNYEPQTGIERIASRPCAQTKYNWLFLSFDNLPADVFRLMFNGPVIN